MIHEDYQIRYNEIMFEERDFIIGFLQEVADLRYGNQMYEWALNDLKLFEADHDPFIVKEIALGKDNTLIIRGESVYGHPIELNAEHFAYGELSKIIDALPEPGSVIIDNATADFCRWCKDCSVNLEESPFIFKDGDSSFEVHQVIFDKQENKIEYEVKETINGKSGWGLWPELSPTTASALRNHVNKVILHRSQEYQRLKQLLSQFGGNLYNFVEDGEAGSVFITPRGTDLQLMVLNVSMEHGTLEILVSTGGTRIAETNDDDVLTLYEKDIEPQYLTAIISHLEEPGIIDTLNAHNPSIVERINRAWKNPQLHNQFGPILYSLAQRDKQEFEDKFNHPVPADIDATYNWAHEIMEQVCDDYDLETILHFLRYED